MLTPVTHFKNQIFACACAFAIACGTNVSAQQFADVEGAVEKGSWEPTDPALKNAKYRDRNLPVEQRIDDLLSHLSMEEKAEIIHGASGYTYGKMPRIGMREFGTYDGPQGVRLSDDKASTALPSGIAMAATWDRDLMVKVGNVLGEECLAANGRVVLGPGVNMIRTPLGGRSYEYFSEDPVLAGKMAAKYIQGMQEKGVAACLKHWLLNDQEWARTIINVDTGERALREIYAKPYEIAVRECSPWSIMTSYNRVRGLYPSGNYELNQILYKDYDWDGALISDWGAWHGDVFALNGGCTIAMPSGKDEARNKKIAQEVENGTINREMFDQAVRRNLRLAFRVGAFDFDAQGPSNTEEQKQIALKTAQDSIVLLKNANEILPLDKASIKKIAVIGPNADQYHTMVDGYGLQDRGGAGAIRGKFEITPLKGIANYLGEDKVLFAPGFRFQEPKLHSCPDLKEMDPVEAAKEADIVLFFGGTDHSYDRERLGWGMPEGADKPDLELKGDQVSLIKKVIEANPKTIVILTAGAPVRVEEWQEAVPGILCSWYGGQDAGTAVASVLFGDVNPSGKLPCTFGRELTDWLCHQLGQISYPGIIPTDKEGKNLDPQQFYGDYIWVGYRHFDKAGAEPRYHFGYGMSYTTFAFEPVKSEGSNMTVKVTNTGKRAGAEVVQCYLSKPEGDVIMPVKELVDFSKVFLNPGESREVSFAVTEDAMKYWDEKENGWKVAPGEYKIFVGNSSSHLPVSHTFSK